MELDETRIRNAAHLMVTSLAHVTCMVLSQTVDHFSSIVVFSHLMIQRCYLINILHIICLCYLGFENGYVITSRNPYVAQFQVSSGIHFRV